LGSVVEPAESRRSCERDEHRESLALSIEDAMDFFNTLEAHQKGAGNFARRHQRKSRRDCNSCSTWASNTSRSIARPTRSPAVKRSAYVSPRQLGSGLVGALYVLDEPTIGLHQRDNDKLIETLKHLRDLGNTVIVVEHDEDTIYASDYMVDIGPGAGVHGGEIVVRLA
jgi:hypothetical protein